MAGICGIFGLMDQELLKRMTKILKRRGTDGEYYCFEKNVAFGYCFQYLEGHSLGLQPLSKKNGSIWACIDGCIYNAEELRVTLEGMGHSFQTEDDSEVILRAYEEWDHACFEYFDGMFAIALWDSRKKELLLVRDRMGCKPFYYAFSPNLQQFVFASEIKAILANPSFERAINYTALCELKVLKYTTGDKTFLEKVFQVLPGYRVSVGEDDGNIFFQKYQFGRIEFKPMQTSEKQAAKKLKKILENSVERCLQDDTGIFLSGGLDSTIIAVLASDLCASQLYTFNIADTMDFEDRMFSRKVAEYIDSEHTEITTTLDEQIAELPTMVFLAEIPGKRGATYLVAKKVREKVNVALTGEGSDEIFGGYWLDLKAYENRLYKRFREIQDIKGAEPIASYLSSMFKSYNNIQLNNMTHQLANGHLLFHDKTSLDVQIRFPFLKGSVVDFSNALPKELKVAQGKLKHILRIAFDFRDTPLQNISEREKSTYSDAFRNVDTELMEFVDDVISDRYYKSHPYRQFFSSKSDMVFFDLFYKIFIEDGGKEPEFGLRDLYSY
ncbi:asparagine synthase (glutamine-hydrolyzing) [Thermodesulfobacteriota bacterium]